MSGEDHEGETLTASELLAWWESLRRPDEPERLPLEPRSAYEIDREGSVFRVSPPKLPRRLAAVGLATARQYAARDPDFDPKRRRERSFVVWFPEGYGPPLVCRSLPPEPILYGTAEDRWTFLVRLPSAAERKPPAIQDLPPGVRGPKASWAAGQPLPAVGDTDRGWFLLDLPDRSSLLFHGPSKAAEVFGRYREATAWRRGD